MFLLFLSHSTLYQFFMEMNFLSDFFMIAKYIVYAIGSIGIIVLIIGLLKDQRDLTMKGGYMIVLALVLGVCGYFIYNATVDRAKDRMYEYLDSASSTGY